MSVDDLVAVTKLMDKHYTPGRRLKICEIIVHHNAGNLTVESCWQTWQTRSASAHYQVERNGRIGRLVNDTDTAWHASNGTVNARSIGIEHADATFAPTWTISDETLDAGARLVAELCREHGLGRPEWGRNIRGHGDVAATTCPGAIGGAQRAAYMARAQAWYDGTPQAPETPPLPAERNTMIYIGGPGLPAAVAGPNGKTYRLYIDEQIPVAQTMSGVVLDGINARQYDLAVEILTGLGYDVEPIRRS